MRKIHVLWLVLVAVFAFSAFAASSAFAVSKILWNNEEIVALLNFEVLGSLLLEDMGAFGSPDILCTGTFDGMVEAGGTLAFIEELLTEGGVAGNMLDCTGDKTCTGNLNLVTVLNLPWHLEIKLDLEPANNIYLVHFLSGAEEAGKEPAYVVDCNTALGLVEDECTGLSSARLINNAAGLLGYFNSLADTETWGAESEPANCTVGGVGQGLIESVTLGAEEDTEGSGGLIEPVGGGTFSVSE